MPLFQQLETEGVIFFLKLHSCSRSELIAKSGELLQMFNQVWWMQALDVLNLQWFTSLAIEDLVNKKKWTEFFLHMYCTRS